ncbi:MAG: T9SS type A sorting domain-containing protein, partial [candidate division Zixibacteria bacterium]|nr:T9SS type A sorting domain-containing protein [Gammaproteobacteria bacterium]NIX55553.1 T9SS type A sorting domain-containing protein [candidate division Zixibacteria bacterium]
TSEVELSIYNMLGQKVKTLVSKPQQAGAHTIQWHAKDDRGNALASGVYLYRLQAGNFSQTRKLMLLK